MLIKPIGLEEAATTVVGTSSTVGGSKVVRILNNSGSNATATLVDESDNVISTFTINGEVMYLSKRPSDKLYASATTVLFTPVAYPKG